MPGVEFHANAVQTLLFGSFLRVQDAYSSIIAIFLLSAAAGFALSRWKLVRATIAVAAITAAYTAASFAAFDSGLILTMLYPMLSAALTYVATVGYSYATESRQRKQVTDIFGKYVSADIVKELLKNPDQIKLGGKRKEMTIMFSDIRGFTALSERMKPEELVHFMNDYLTAMSSIVMRNRGVVDKYIGDAIMAFWGAPLDDPAHAEKALAAAVEMIAGLEKFRAGRKNIGLSIGIGINSGPAVVGNMGSEQRFSYTAMGDTVNLASRLEGLNKEYGTCIIASEESFRQAMPKFFGRELDLVRVKGKQKPVRIFEIMAKSGEETEKQKEIRRFFESGLGLYRKRKWSAAIKEFSKAERLGDRASGKFIGRCRALSRERLPRGWDGVFEAKTK
jgi:adenylate cyclase